MVLFVLMSPSYASISIQTENSIDSLVDVLDFDTHSGTTLVINDDAVNIEKQELIHCGLTNEEDANSPSELLDITEAFGNDQEGDFSDICMCCHETLHNNLIPCQQ